MDHPGHARRSGVVPDGGERLEPPDTDFAELRAHGGVEASVLGRQLWFRHWSGELRQPFEILRQLLVTTGTADACWGDPPTGDDRIVLTWHSATQARSILRAIDETVTDNPNTTQTALGQLRRLVDRLRDRCNTLGWDPDADTLGRDTDAGCLAHPRQEGST